MSNRRMFLPVAWEYLNIHWSHSCILGRPRPHSIPFNSSNNTCQSSLPLSGSHHIPIDVIVSPILSQSQRPKPPKLHWSKSATTQRRFKAEEWKTHTFKQYTTYKQFPYHLTLTTTMSLCRFCWGGSEVELTKKQWCSCATCRTPWSNDSHSCPVKCQDKQTRSQGSLK